MSEAAKKSNVAPPTLVMLFECLNQFATICLCIIQQFSITPLCNPLLIALPFSGNATPQTTSVSFMSLVKINILNYRRSAWSFACGSRYTKKRKLWNPCEPALNPTPFWRGAPHVSEEMLWRKPQRHCLGMNRVFNDLYMDVEHLVSATCEPEKQRRQVLSP